MSYSIFKLRNTSEQESRSRTIKTYMKLVVKLADKYAVNLSLVLLPYGTYNSWRTKSIHITEVSTSDLPDDLKKGTMDFCLNYKSAVAIVLDVDLETVHLFPFDGSYEKRDISLPLPSTTSTLNHLKDLLKDVKRVTIARSPPPRPQSPTLLHDYDNTRIDNTPSQVLIPSPKRRIDNFGINHIHSIFSEPSEIVSVPVSDNANLSKPMKRKKQRNPLILSADLISDQFYINSKFKFGFSDIEKMLTKDDREGKTQLLLSSELDFIVMLAFQKFKSNRYKFLQSQETQQLVGDPICYALHSGKAIVDTLKSGKRILAPLCLVKEHVPGDAGSGHWILIELFLNEANVLLFNIYDSLDYSLTTELIVNPFRTVYGCGETNLFARLPQYKVDYYIPFAQSTSSLICGWIVCLNVTLILQGLMVDARQEQNQTKLYTDRSRKNLCLVMYDLLQSVQPDLVTEQNVIDGSTTKFEIKSLKTKDENEVLGKKQENEELKPLQVLLESKRL
ncbi:hypothetical protein GEMRC1_007098 [Eukaryota sp. GEM-RC1]